MTRSGKRGTQGRTSRHLPTHDGRRTLIACLCLAPLLVVGVRLGNESISSIVASFSGPPPRTADDELKTGSILFIPPYGDRCRRLLIDNATWFIADNGFVDCKDALAQAKARIGEPASARMDGIRAGFRKN